MKRFISACFSIAALVGAFALLLAIQGQQQRNALLADVIIASEKHAAAQSAQRAELWTSFLAGLYDLMLIIAWAAAALLLLALATWIYQRVVDARLTRFAPTASGLYPLQIVGGQLINPNLMIYAALADNGPANVPPAAALAASTSADRIVVSSNMSQLHLNAAGAKLLAGRYDPAPAQLPACAPAQLPSPQPEPAREPAAPLQLTDAWQQSTDTRWLLGQSASGKPYSLDLTSAVHVGLLGATGTGKTSSTALLLALHARRHGYEVLVLDGKGGVDWSPYAGAFDVQPTDYTTFGDQITAIERIHRQRMATLKANNAPTIRHLTDVSYPPLLVIVEEAGYTAQSLRMADSSQAEHVANMQSNLMRVSRATGIHFLMIDQSPQHWPGVVKANIKSWICYKLGSGQANAVNLYHAHKLPANGAFVASDDDGETIYRSWHTAAHAAPMLRQLPASRRIIGAKYTVHPAVPNPVPDPVPTPFLTPFQPRSPEVEPLPTNAANATNAEPDAEQIARWQSLVDAWFADHPDALTGPALGISDIARAMASADGRPTEYENYKSTAHRMFHDFRRSVRINGKPFGADKSTVYPEQ